jgi:hypothetical protein
MTADPAEGSYNNVHLAATDSLTTHHHLAAPSHLPASAIRNDPEFHALTI